MTPEQVLDKQMLIRRFWEQPGARGYGEHMMSVIFPNTRNDKEFDLPFHEHTVLGTAETFYVTHDMGIQIEMMAQQLPDGIVCPLSLPLVSRGFVWLDHPLVMLDINELPIAVRAFTWNVRKVALLADGPNDVLGQEDALIICMYADDDMGDPQRDALTIKSLGQEEFFSRHYQEFREFLRRYDPTLFHVAVVVKGEPVHLANIPVRYLVAFWSLIRQPLVLTTKAHLPRAVQRRAERGGLKFSDVTVVELRQVLTTPLLKSERGDRVPGAQFSWQFRYPVTGHPKRQYYPKLGPPRNADGSFNEDSHRWIWIDEYEKGPPEAPLYPKDRIYKVRR